MSQFVKYIIDTSALINAWHLYYPPKNFPTLWDKLTKIIKNGYLKAPLEVFDELEEGGDDLYKWAKDLKTYLFEERDEIQDLVVDILHQFPYWANRDDADPFVIAMAQFYNASIICCEKPDGRKNPAEIRKIPDACRALGIRYLHFYQLVVEKEWSF